MWLSDYKKYVDLTHLAYDDFTHEADHDIRRKLALLIRSLCSLTSVPEPHEVSRWFDNRVDRRRSHQIGKT